jgi:hypothetical protein
MAPLFFARKVRKHSSGQNFMAKFQTEAKQPIVHLIMCISKVYMKRRQNKKELTCETWSAIEFMILFHLDIYVDAHPVLFDFRKVSAITTKGH